LATIQVSSPAQTIKPEDGQQQSNDSIWCLISFKRYQGVVGQLNRGGFDW
jgi:hypothetical protein